MSNFKKQYLNGEIEYEAVLDFIDEWHAGDSTKSLEEFLGLTKHEMQLMANGDDSLKKELDRLKTQRVASALRKVLENG
jgi:hypothetical protein